MIHEYNKHEFLKAFLTELKQDSMLIPNPQAASMFLFFSEIQEAKILDSDGLFLGRLYDILIEPIGKYAKAKTLIIKKKGFALSWALVPWGVVAQVSKGCIRLNKKAPEVAFTSSLNHKADLSIRRDILDQQVVDMNNQNVIRVNDIHLLMAEEDLVVAHVDIGLRGIVRRLGFEKFVDTSVRFFDKNSRYLQKLWLISWKHIQPLSINPVSMTIKVDVSQKQLNEIPAADLSEIMLDLSQKHRVALFKLLDITTKSKLLCTLGFKEQKSLLEEVGEREAVEILNQLPTDEAVDLLSELPKSQVHNMLGLMESKNAKMLSTLLGYSGESAAGLMTTEYVTVPETASIEQALVLIKEKTPKAETIQTIFIVDQENHLMGSTVLRRLMIADLKDGVKKAAFKKTVSIHMEDEVKKIAFLMDKYKIYVLPVVDSLNVLVGIITIDDIFSRLVSIAWRRSNKKKHL